MQYDEIKETLTIITVKKLTTLMGVKPKNVNEIVEAFAMDGMLIK